MLDDPSYNIEGLILLDNSCVRVQGFADDTALFLKGDPDNLNQVSSVIDLFLLGGRCENQLAEVLRGVDF